MLSSSVVTVSLRPHGLCSPPGPSVHEDSPGKNTGVGCHALLQGIFLTEGLNPGLPHCRQILYQSVTGEFPKYSVDVLKKEISPVSDYSVAVYESVSFD